jgi:hypothetical protein
VWRSAAQDRARSTCAGAATGRTSSSVGQSGDRLPERRRRNRRAR